jgi:hypothetical protein
MLVVDSGLQSFGEDLSGVARDLKDVEMVDRQAVLDEADIATAIATEDIRGRYKDDPDFGTSETRGGKEYDDAIGKIGEGIANEKDRKRWMAAQTVDAAKLRTGLRGDADIKQRDANRAGINDQTADLRKAALTSETPGELVAQYERRLESGYARGDITAVEQEKMGREFKEQITGDRLSRMDADDVTAALNDPNISGMLNPDQILLYTEKAETETVYNSAVTVVDTEMGNPDATAESIGIAIDNIKDPKVRKQAESIYRSELAAKKTADTEKATNAYDALDKMARDAATVFELRGTPEYQHLTPSQRNSVEATSIAQTTGVKRTVNNAGVHAEASRLAENKEWRQLDNLLNGYGDQLTGSTRDKYRTAAADGKAPEEVKYAIMVDSAIGGGSKTLDKRNAVKVKMADWQDQFRDSMEREPTRAEVQNEVDVYTQELVTDVGRIWDTTQDPTYGSTDDDSMAQHAALREVEMREDNEDAFLNAQAVVGRGANQFTMAREFDNQKTILGYKSLQSPQSKSLWEAVDKASKLQFSVSKVPLTSQEIINVYENQRNKVMFE